MKPSSWFVPWRAATLAVAGALCGAANAQPIETPHLLGTSETSAPLSVTLAQAVDAAWARSPLNVEAQGRQRVADAARRVADSWLVAPPSLNVAQREGVSAATRGERETEIGVSLPLWRWDQRARSQASASAEAAWAHASQQVARWQVAGLVREAAARVRLAQADLSQVNAQQQLLSKLAEDVARRVRAGDLAPADELAARAELLGWEAQTSQARWSLQAELSEWQTLTGLSALPLAEPVATPVPVKAQENISAHIAVQLANLAVELARARVASASQLAEASPELGVSWRQERANLGGAQSSVALSMKLPLGTAKYLQPQLAAALAAEETALAEQAQTQRHLSAQLELAQAQWASTQAQATSEQERARLLRQRGQWLQRSFSAGETSLPDLLRALTAAAQAEAASARQQAALTQAWARLQHAQGLMP
ncbi:TolC family protein [Aquabacterium sp.]|uniref:TolC family protein n=1 Tax=Aquabacterium sp. TaxID=1872578 RepID=UPI0035AE3062